MMILIKLIFSVVGIFFILTVFTGLSLWMRVRQYLQNPLQQQQTKPTPPPGKGDIIEGEYRVLDEK